MAFWVFDILHVYSAGNIDIHGRHAPLKAKAKATGNWLVFMVLFTDQRKFHRPGAGTSPAHEAGIPTSWNSDSWNDGPPGRYFSLQV